MLTRIVAGLTGLAIVLPAIFFGGELAIQIIAGIAVLIGLDEYSRMAVPKDVQRPAFVLLLLGGAGVYAAHALGDGTLLGPALALGSVACMTWALLRVPDTERAATIGLRLVAGLVYVPLLLSFLVLVRRFNSGVAWVMLILVITWAGDTGAYFAGRAFGKRKLFARVSPKKTWEGAIGGMLAAVAGACVVREVGLTDVPWVHIIVLGILVDAAGVVGDLAESMLKRAFGVKDSGWIMPGHGGILDRVDSLLFTGPVTWAYVTVFALS